MYALRLLKTIRPMERKQNSKVMLITINKQMEIGTIIPITVDDKYIISEAKVLGSNMFYSTLKIVLLSDHEQVPEFEVYNSDDRSVEIPKHANMGTTEQQCMEMERIIKQSELQDIRPCNINTLKILVPDILDYSGLSNLQLNVRFKS